MHERERRLPGNENQRALLLEHDVGGALDQRAARPVRDRRHGTHRAGADHHSGAPGGARGGRPPPGPVRQNPPPRPLPPPPRFPPPGAPDSPPPPRGPPPLA